MENLRVPPINPPKMPEIQMPDIQPPPPYMDEETLQSNFDSLKVRLDEIIKLLKAVNLLLKNK
jgi:hypothetical protein